MGPTQDLKNKVNKENATLEDAFVFFTGDHLQENGNFHEIRHLRQTMRRLG